jgi:integrase/recombinase XerD
MLELYYQYRRVMTRSRGGALGNEIDRIAADLRQIGYKRDSVKLYLSRIARFSSFAAQCGCRKSTPIAACIVNRFLRTRPTISTRWAAQVAIRHARRLFPERFAAQPSHKAFDADPDGPLLADYLQHLRQVRGFQVKTCEGLLLTARRMLAWHNKQLCGRPLAFITAKHVLAMTHDLLTACGSDGSRSATTACMRSFLRYLHWAERNAQDLARFVPRTPCWRLAHLPPRLAWEDVRRAIDAIEITTPSGIRDRALLLVLATTGLRNKELRQLQLEDIRWRAAEIVVRRAKGHRDRIVPLLEETGAALAKYVIHSRPRTEDRSVFLSHVPPVRAFSYSSTVSRIVRVRLQNAGVPVKRGGAHLLRHSLATRLVAQRRPIKEVADLLGHRNIDTTSIYVKIALPQLADVALPFPGGAR